MFDPTVDGWPAAETAADPDGASGLLEVTDLKQYRYCPRVVFYHYCLPAVRPITYKMEHGIRSHVEEAGREARRGLQLYGLPEGERIPDLRLTDAGLGLRGRVDLVIAVPNRAQVAEAIPVEYKWSTRAPGPHFRLQVAAYACLLEAAWGVPVRRGLIYEPPVRRAVNVAITPRLRREVRATVAAIYDLVQAAWLPEAPATRLPCVSCEFRRFCNDVI